MSKTFPGTTIEVSKIEKGSSRILFEGIFATGGITLSQVSVMTGLEPYIVQNWVKRGFLTSPKKRVYSKSQFARIVLINMLRETLQIDKICGLIKVIGGELEDETDDLISDDELYHRYVDMISSESINVLDADCVKKCAAKAVESYIETLPGAKKKLEKILQVMFYAHAAAELRSNAEEMLTTIK
jgi:DNA-binding transcriptional MerR regulator